MTSRVMDAGPGNGHSGAMTDDVAGPASRPLEELVAMMPFAAGLGIEITAAAPDEVVGHMAWRADLCTTFGAMHGGALMAMADSVGAVCAFLNLPEGATTSTIESKTNFFRGVREGSVHSTSR